MREAENTEQNDGKPTDADCKEKDAIQLLDKGYYSKSRKIQCILSCFALLVIYCILLYLVLFRQRYYLSIQLFVKILTPTLAAVSAWFDWSIRNMNNTIDVELPKDEADNVKKTEEYKNRLSFKELMRALFIVAAFMLALLALA